MTAKQLKTLSKAQLINVLLQQSREIELLNEAARNPQAAAGPQEALGSQPPGGMSPQSRADEGAHAGAAGEAEKERLEKIAAAENDLRQKYEEVEKYRMDAIRSAEKMTNDLYQLFMWLKLQIDSIHDDLKERIGPSVPGGNPSAKGRGGAAPSRSPKTRQGGAGPKPNDWF